MKPVFFTICFLVFSIIIPARIQAGEKLIDDFSGPQLSSAWQKKTFAGETEYFLTAEEGIPCLKAISKQAASGLVYKIKFNPAEFPYLSWSWKVDSIVASGDALRRQGDDYAARVYVVFPSFFFWKTRAINYIWANRLPINSSTPNQFTKNAMMFAVESGPGRIGRWVTESRNIYEDYKKLFHEDPPMVGAVAIMTDTDNTGATASACYGPIRIHSSPAP